MLAEVEDAVAGLKDVSAGLMSMGESAEKTDAQTAKLNLGIVSVGTALSALAPAAIWAAADVETAMAKTSSAFEGTGVSAQQLAARFNDMGLSATDMLMAAEQGAKSGIKGSDSLVLFADTAKKMSKVTGQSTEGVANSLSKMAVSMKLGAPEVEKLASSIVYLSQRTRVSASALESVVTRIGPMAKEAGITTPSLLGLATALDQGGLQARRAIGPISKLVELMGEGDLPGLSLASAIGMGGDRLQEWADMEPDQQMKLFINELGRMPKMKAEATLKGLGIASGLTADQFISAARDTGKFNKALGLAQTGFNDTSTLTKEYEDIMGTLTEQVKSLWLEFTVLAQTAGTWLLPILKSGVVAVRVLVGVLAWVPGPILAIGAAFLSLVGAIMLFSATSKLALYQSMIAATKQAAGMVVGIYKVIYALIAQSSAQNAATLAMYKNVTASQYQMAAKIRLIGLWLMEKAVILQVAIVSAFYTVKQWLATAATWAATVAMSAYNLAMSAGGGAVKMVVSGISVLVSGFMTMIPVIWGAVTAAWALAVPVIILMAKILLVVAIVLALIWVFKKAIEMFMEGSGWVQFFGAAILMALGPIGMIILAFLVLKKYGKQIKEFFVGMWEGIKIGAKAALDAILWPFRKIGEAAAWLKGKLFGSGFLHIPEGASAAESSAYKMIQPFEVMGQVIDKLIGTLALLPRIIADAIAAIPNEVRTRVKLDTQLPDEIKARMDEPVGARAANIGKINAEPGVRGHTGSTSGGGGASAPSSPTEITIPVTVELDGFILARVIAKHIVEIGRERYMNEPLNPLRGIEGA
jgi:TP901 family phage tail tape measure protein